MLLPTLLAFLVNKQCPIGNTAGKDISFRPNPKVFIVVWTILNLLTGYSWVCTRRKKELNKFTTDILYILLNVSLCSWIYYYSCEDNKIKAFYSLPISMLFTMIIIMYNPSFYLLPLLVWLLFASYINFAEII